MRGAGECRTLSGNGSARRVRCLALRRCSLRKSGLTGAMRPCGHRAARQVSWVTAEAGRTRVGDGGGSRPGSVSSSVQRCVAPLRLVVLVVA